MKCSKCGAELPGGAQSCPSCGHAITSQPQQQLPSKKPMIYGIAVLAAIAIAALIFAMFAARGSKSVTVAVSPDATSARPVTSAPAPPAPNSAPITQAPAPNVPPPGQPVPEAQVPPEVLDYLNYVKRIEELRQTLLKDQGKALALASQGQANSLMKLFDMAEDIQSDTDNDPFKPCREELSRQVGNWQALLKNFDAKPVPQQCGQFAGPYRMVIATEASKIQKLAVILAGVSESNQQSIQNALGELQGMRKDPALQGDIDKAVEVADSSLGSLCTQYGIQKPFNVMKEQGGGSLIGL